jgi:hypothetical protein
VYFSDVGKPASNKTPLRLRDVYRNAFVSGDGVATLYRGYLKTMPYTIVLSGLYLGLYDTWSHKLGVASDMDASMPPLQASLTRAGLAIGSSVVASCAAAPFLLEPRAVSWRSVLSEMVMGGFRVLNWSPLALSLLFFSQYVSGARYGWHSGSV